MFISWNSLRWQASLVAGCLVCCLWTLPAVAQAPTSGWRMPTLNPFAGRANDNRSTAAKVLDPFGLIPGTNNARSSTASFGQQPQQPTMWQKVTAGPKKVVSQTADFLNPFNDAPPPVREERLTGNNSFFNQQANRRPVQKAKESKSWLPGWPGGNASEEAKPKTVNDFLSQPRLAP